MAREPLLDLVDEIQPDVVRPLNVSPSALAGGALVRFRSGEQARIPDRGRADERNATILHHARSCDLPVLVRFGTDASAVESVQLAFAGIVAEVRTLTSGDVEVVIAPSSAYHYLRRNRPDFARLKATLDGSIAAHTTVLVSETLEEGIVDARPAPPSLTLEWAVGVDPDVHTLQAAPTISIGQARDAFHAMTGQSCPLPPKPTTLCIPFLYPRDGCYARAHQMCRLISTLRPGKAWNYGSLKVSTPNDPTCTIAWSYHVAPVLNVLVGGAGHLFVVDPSMFQDVVPIDQWRHAQSDPNSNLVLTGPDPYYRDPTGRVMLDSEYKNTELRLHYFQGELLSQVSRYGPMPYAQCHRLVERPVA